MFRLSNIYLFVVLLAVNVFGKAIYFSYLVGTLTTIEKRYGFSSTRSGIILSGYDIGYIFSVIVGTYIGDRLHPPRSVSLTTLLLTLAMLCWTIPFFVFPTSEIIGSTAVDNSGKFVCNATRNSLDQQCESEIFAGPSLISYTIFMLSHIACGLTGSIGFPIGCAYIANHCKKEQVSFLLGVVISIYSFGQIFGFLLSSLTLSLYETPWKQISITKKDPEWIGAWWVGYVVTAFIELITVVPFAFYPRKIVKENDTELLELQAPLKEARDEVDRVRLPPPKVPATKRLLKASLEFFGCVWLLIKNPTFICLVISNTAICWALGGFGPFIPKYLEQSFSLTPDEANVISGVGIGVAACLGMVIGGAVTSFFRLGYRAQAKVVVISMFLAVIPSILVLFLKCEQPRIYGTYGDVDKSPVQRLQVTNTCNENCGCSFNDFVPTCYEKHTSAPVTEFISPCWAGCLSTQQMKLTDGASSTVYGNCSCLGIAMTGRGNDSTDVLLKSGSCPVQCDSVFYAYIVLVAVATFFGLFSQGPMFTLLFKSCGDAERPLSLATLYALNSVLGWIPAPIATGSLVDSECIWKKKTCSDGKFQEHCALYDNSQFMIKVHAVFIISQAIAFLSTIPTLYTSKQIETKARIENLKVLREKEKGLDL